VTFGKQLSHVLPPLPEIKIRKDALANRLAAFKHKLAHAAGQIGVISRLYVLRANWSGLTTKPFSHELLSLARTSRKSYSHLHTIHKTVTCPSNGLASSTYA
jgi:hypothetical protein